MGRTPAASPAEVLPDLRRPRWGFVAAVAAAATIVVTVVMLLPAIMVRLHPPEVREPGEWRFTHRLEPVAGMTVTRRILTVDHEFTIVESDDDVAQCTVDLTLGEQRPIPVGQSSPVRIRGWSAGYVDEGSHDPYVTWDYAPGARATVTCTRQSIPPTTLLAVAEAVRFEDARVRIPFTFAALPTGYRIYSLDEDTGSGADVLSLVLQPVDRASIPSIVVRYGSDDAAYRCLDDPATGPDRPSARAAHSGRVCLTTRWSAEEAPGAQAVVRQSLDRVAERIRPAPDLADRSTWFDAVDLPH